MAKVLAFFVMMLVAGFVQAETYDGPHPQRYGYERHHPQMTKVCHWNRETHERVCRWVRAYPR